MRWVGGRDVVKRGGKRPLERRRCRWEDNIGMDIREIGWVRCELEASDLRWGPVVGFCEHDNEPLGSIKGGSFLAS
jgi:hypothetical protein